MHTDHGSTERADHAKARVIDIELLALDLTSCTRCVGTLQNIRNAIRLVRPVLEATGSKVNVTALLIESEEQARQHRFVTSPTVRVNGREIVFETLESQCDSCTDLCGCDEGTSCRVWSHQGKEFTEAPVGLVVEALLHEIGGSSDAVRGASPSEEVPENLRRFFASTTPKQQVKSGPCCSSAEQDACCAPEEKAGCCDAKEPAACGCR